MAMSTSQSQDPSRVQDAARTPKQWGQLLFFYFCFYGWLIAFFAICYSVMFSTLPDRRSPPKLDNLINPGLVLIPDSFSLSDINTPSFADSYSSEQRDLTRFGERTPFSNKRALDIADTSVFEACADTLNGVMNTTYGQLEPCIFAKLNRVFNFPEAGTTINVDAVLDYPSEADFMATYGISFTDFKNQHMRFLPATITPPVPFTNNPGVYKDSVAAVQFNFTSFQQDIIDGTLEFDFRIGIQFDYGQNKLQSVGRGYQILDVNVRQ